MTLTDRDLYLKLTGYPLALRCVWKCPACGGKGKYSVREGHGEWSGKFEKCPTCDGHGVVFRDDEEGRKLIAEAIRSVRTMDSAEVMDGFDYPLDVWQNRHGQPWRAAIEQHVRDWEAPPPDLSDERVLMDMLVRQRMYYSLQFDPNESEETPFWALAGHERRWRGAFTRIAALRAAVEAALGGE